MDTWKLTEGPSGAKRDIRFEIFVRSIVGGASSGIIQPRRKTVDVCVDEFNAFLHPSSRNAAQRIQDGARRTIESLDPALKRVIMKVGGPFTSFQGLFTLHKRVLKWMIDGVTGVRGHL